MGSGCVRDMVDVCVMSHGATFATTTALNIVTSKGSIGDEKEGSSFTFFMVVV